MPDVFTKAQRSDVMSRIRGRGNKETELALAKLLRAAHITGWRRQQKVFGKPDFIVPKVKVAIFVDGCFWHGCPRHSNMPKNNALFWRKKLSRNRTRDLLVNRSLKKCGWRVLRIWEHDLAKRGEICVSKIRAALTAVRELSRHHPRIHFVSLH